jgi:hypothetical protein
MADKATAAADTPLPDIGTLAEPQADPPAPDSAQLAALGNVPADYHHHAKQVEPAAGIALPGGFLKWYDVHSPDAAIRPETQDQARDFLRGEAAAGRLMLREELGFVILHRCGADTYFLIACTWRNHNEMWQTDYGRTGDGAFGPLEHDDTHHATQCVWELAATAHERLAWTRYLNSARDEAAKRAYLLDVYAGEA